MSITPFGWLMIGGVSFLAVAYLCSRWLETVDRRRHRPIAEHSDAYWHGKTDYQRRNEANEGSFR